MGYPIYHSQYTAAQIEASLGKTPRIKASTRTWEIWDIATSQYVDTGVSIDTQLFVDPTLTESGYAADAKVTGDKIGELKSALGFRKNLAPTYPNWGLKYNADTETITDDAASFTMTAGKTFVFGNRYELTDTPFSVGDTVYYGVYNVAVTTSAVSGTAPFKIIYYNGETELSRETWSIANGTAFAKKSGTIPANTTAFVIRVDGSQMTALSMGKSVLSNADFGADTDFTRGTPTGLYKAQEDISEAQEDISEAQEDISDLNERVTDLEFEITDQNVPVSLASAQNGYYVSSNNKLSFTEASNSRAVKVNLSEYIGKTVYISTTGSTATTSTRLTAMADNAGNYANAYQEKDIINKTFGMEITSEYPYLWFSWNYGQTPNPSVYVFVEAQINEMIDSEVAKYGLKTVYISTAGNDNNAGSYAAPFRTLAKALSVASNVIVLGGIYDGENIVATDYDYPSIHIHGAENQTVVFNFGSKHLVDDGSETLVSGKVYSVPCATMPFAEGCTKARMYQDYVPDAATEIPASDRHPLQRGKQYRVDSTVIRQQPSIAAI